MGCWNNAGMWTAGWGMLLWAVVLIALIAVAAILVARAVRTQPKVPDRGYGAVQPRDPEDELRMRYARGQLDGEEFRRRMQDLQDL